MPTMCRDALVGPGAHLLLGHYVSNPPDEHDFQFVRQEGLRTVKG